MSTWTITFYNWMLAFMYYGLAIAKSTGRNPDDVAQKVSDINSIEHTVDILEIQQ